MVTRLSIMAGSAVLFALVAVACIGDESLKGTVLDGDPAPLFDLRNQFDQVVALDDYSGDVVLLTFLYTYCLDVCPVVTDHLRTVHELLLDDSKRVNFVAISVDPERDTVERALEYSELWRMLDKWDFLVGQPNVLAPIWSSYYLDPQQIKWTDGDGPAPVGQGDASTKVFRRQISKQYEVGHVTPVYLLDNQRRMRVLFTPPLVPSEIVHDIRTLLD